jgi:hypothetical protein
MENFIVTEAAKAGLLSLLDENSTIWGVVVGHTPFGRKKMRIIACSTTEPRDITFYVSKAFKIRTNKFGNLLTSNDVYDIAEMIKTKTGLNIKAHKL